MRVRQVTIKEEEIIYVSCPEVLYQTPRECKYQIHRCFRKRSLVAFKTQMPMKRTLSY